MSRSPKVVLAVVVAVLAAGAVSTAAAGAKPVSGHTLLKRVERAFTSAGRRQLTPLLKQLAIRLPHLRGAERRRAESLLARPTDGNADPQANGWTVPEASNSPACSDHYCVHWVDSSPDAPNLTDADGNGVPDYVDSVIATAEHVHSVENDQLGWRAPKGDGTLGGGTGVDKTDIYLNQLGGTGIYGYSAPDPNQGITSRDHSTFAYTVIDNDFQKSEFPQYASPLTPLQVTVAHEYNHLLQFNYDTLQDTWMLESTAVWMEGKVYPEAHDYLQYLPGWVGLTTVPITSFNGDNPNDRNNVKVYGSSVWNKYLDAKYGQDIVRNAWEGSLAAKSFAVGAYDAAIRQHGGSGFQDDFDRFAAATAEWQAVNSGFPEGALYPDVDRAGSFRVDGQGGSTRLNHTTYALVDVASSSASRIKFSMAAPAGTAAAVALVGRTGGLPGGNMTLALHEMPAGGTGTVILTHPSRYARITAVLINSDAKTSGGSSATGDFIYKRDRQLFYGRVSTDFTAPRVVSSSPSPGAANVVVRPQVKVTFSEPVLGVSANSLELLASNGRRVRAKVTFKPRSRMATLVPTRPLGHAKSYRVRVLASVTDTALNPLARTVSWRFRTG
jgi:hypothetical protein